MRLFSQMVFVAAIRPVNHIADDRLRLRVALGQQVSGLMLVAHELGFRGVAFRKNQMPDDVEACGAESGEEAVGFRPALSSVSPLR